VIVSELRNVVVELISSLCIHDLLDMTAIETLERHPAARQQKQVMLLTTDKVIFSPTQPLMTHLLVVIHDRLLCPCRCTCTYKNGSHVCCLLVACFSCVVPE
jgi:hypothetical protein